MYEELALVDKPENSFVYQYLFRLLNNARSAPFSSAADDGSRQSSTMSHVSDVATTKPIIATTRQAVPSGQSGMPPARSSDIEMNQALKEIFDKIGNTQESKNGIAELYDFQKLHPE